MIPNPYPGAFFVVEGIDGCGKSEQVGRLFRGISVGIGSTVIRIKEPNKDGLYGKKIYEDLYKPNGLHVTNPFGFQRWHSCESKISLRNVVIPALRVGNIIISDRYRPSMVYGANNEAEIEELTRINEAILGEDFIWPDAIFILNVSVEEAIKRLMKKGRKLDGHEKKKVLYRVQANYRLFARKYPNCYLINGNESIECIYSKISSIVQTVLIPKGLLSGGDE